MFIDEWFADGFYQQLPLNYRTELSFGQFCWTHALYTYENLQIWRPHPDYNDLTTTIATTFRIESVGEDAFKRGLPLGAPKLQQNEEFIVVRAKKRPVVLIRPEIIMAGVDNQGFRGKVQRKTCLIAQVFGLADTQTGRAEFNPTIVDRVRQMEFPHLMFLPERPGILEVDSWLRLDHLQSVYVPHLEPTQFALGDEVSNVLKEQIKYLFTGEPSDDYIQLRKWLLEE
jgi:hypothetical protein